MKRFGRHNQATRAQIARGVGTLTAISLAFVGCSLLLPAGAQTHGGAQPGHGAPASGQGTGAHGTPGNGTTGHGTPGQGTGDHGGTGGHGTAGGGTGGHGTPAPGHEGPLGGAGTGAGHDAGHGANTAPPGTGGHDTTPPHTGHTGSDTSHDTGGHGEGHGEGAHEEGGHGKHEESVSIHIPTWLSGPLKLFWYAGPATLNADGIVGGRPEDVKALAGKTARYKFVDHHVKTGTPPTFELEPTIGTIGGKTQPGDSDTVEPAVIDGRTVQLINPVPVFARQSMFPEHLAISLLTMLGILIGALLLTRGMRRVPSRKQALAEILYEAFDDFVHGLIGDHYKKYVPFVATLFLYILVMNLAGLIPGWASPTANLNVTGGLAIVVVLYSNIEGIRANGVLGWLKHFWGQPWWLGPLNLVLHGIGELAKILSLSVRLFGNIFGEDVVIVILMLLGLKFTGWFPAQLPMLLLALFTSFVQALVFSILTSVYIALMTTHEDHGEHHGEHHDAHGHLHDTASPAPAV